MHRRWHKRDGPRESYSSPLGINFLVYLQDMTPESGQLRVVPRSHLSGVPTPAPEDKMRPLPGEQLLDARAGDLVALHCDVLHSTTRNTMHDGSIRYFISTYLVGFGLQHRDEFDCDVVNQLVADARRCGDRRIVRLFGQDGEEVEAERLQLRLQRIIRERQRNVHASL
jgi:ectoine hydroxylase-related dioxygenase (phytanoyl-CoA dioxygenase family)